MGRALFYSGMSAFLVLCWSFLWFGFDDPGAPAWIYLYVLICAAIPVAAHEIARLP